MTTNTCAFTQKANNLSDVSSVSAARANLGFAGSSVAIGDSASAGGEAVAIGHSALANTGGGGDSNIAIGHGLTTDGSSHLRPYISSGQLASGKVI